MRLFILGRDGVINFASNDYIKSPGEWIAIPGSLEAIARLNHLGCKVAVVSFRTGLDAGAVDLQTLNAIHEKMHEQLARAGGHIDGVFFRNFVRDEGQDHVEREFELYAEIGARFGLPLSDVPVVASTKTEFAAVMKIGARPILVKTNLDNNTAEDDCETFNDLSQAVDALVAEKPQ